jgi:hypothetical protein
VDDWRNASRGGYQPLTTYTDDRASERAARLTVTGLAASFAVLMVGLVVFVTVHTLREDAKTASPAVAGGTTGATTPEDAAKVVGGIGPPPGVDVVTYAEDRRQALAQATGDRIAVVSFAKYLNETKARAAVGSAEVVALLVAPLGGTPSTVTGDLGTWATAQTADARSERDEIQKLIPTVDDAQFKAFYKSEVDRLTKEIANINPAGDLVFAAVARAPATALQQLATSGDVRLVDVGPSAEPDPKADYRGLRPEETSKANDPNTRPT